MTSEGGVSGVWEDIFAPLYATDDLVTCEGCGAMIPRRFWRPMPDVEERYCGPQCVALVARVEELRLRYGGT
jgi:hypothetical protein